MKANINDRGRSGIYIITNNINEKVYVGKAQCIYKRIKQHITCLNNRIRSHENDHFINAWHKYEGINFSYKVLEYLKLDEKLLSSKELEYFVVYNCLDQKFGYNKRNNSETGLIVSKGTKRKLSNSRNNRKERFPNLDKELGLKMSKFWRDNPDKLNSMKDNLSKVRSLYLYKQYDMSMNFVKKWSTIREILLSNPNYKRHNIYSVCSGEKPSMYGYIWKKVLK